jgi:outer membrane protein assembly factor BamB
MRSPGWLAALAAVAAMAGCSTAPPAGHSGGHAASSRATPPAAPAGWPMYHLNPARTGSAPGLPPAGPLRIAWRARLDGAVYGQPLVIGSTVIAATENDSVYGLDRTTGRVLWRAHDGTPVPLSGQPCGDINPLGITGTPVYDPADRLVYAVTQVTGSRHYLIGVRVSDGRVQVRRLIPAPDHHPAYDQQRGALALLGGVVYVTFGGHFGDCGPYRGSVVAVPASGKGPLRSYIVPVRREGAIWAPAGPVISAGRRIYVGVGNGAATRPPYDDSDSVTELTPALRRVGIFAPSTWAADNAADLDLGSMSPVLLPGGRLLQAGKRGTGYLLSSARLGGVGGQLAQAPVCPGTGAYGGAAVAGHVAYVPCAGGGLAAVSVAGRRLRVLWRGPPGAAGSPVVGGGEVWVTDLGAGLLYELSPATGMVRGQISLGEVLPHFESPSLSGRLVLIGTLDGVVAVSGA